MKLDSSLWALEVERTAIDYSSAWEGKQEQTVDLGDVLLKVQAGFGMAVHLRFTATNIEERIDETIRRIEQIVPWCAWVIGPSTKPADLEERFTARGFTAAFEWDGLVLDDLSAEMPRNPNVVIEPLSWENADEYATHCTTSTNPQFHTYLRTSAHRFLETPQQEVQIFVARLDGEVAGYAVLRMEPNGIAYLRDAMTVERFRRRGVYSSLVAHRLAIAKTAGCTAAVLQAQIKTSAPILIKRGFKSVCRLVALTRNRSTNAEG